ncbi:hypothetical protein [Corynebacterium gerontici]|nr:hypothetical protein [Corynebacterium gerontici]
MEADALSALHQHPAPPLPGTECPGTGAFLAALNAATSSLFHRMHQQGEHAQHIAEHQQRFLTSVIDTDDSLAHTLSGKAKP